MFSKKLRDTCSVRPVSCSDAVKYAHCRGATHRADSAYFGHVASPNLWLGTEAVTAAQVTHHEQKLRLTFWRFLRNALDASMLPGRDAISRPGSCRTRLRTVQVRRSRDAGAHFRCVRPRTGPEDLAAVQRAISAIARRAIARWKLLQNRAVQGDVPLARRRLQHAEVVKDAGAVPFQAKACLFFLLQYCNVVFSIAILQYCNIAILQ